MLPDRLLTWSVRIWTPPQLPADPPQLLQPTHRFIFAPDRPDFLIELTHTFINCRC